MALAARISLSANPGCISCIARTSRQVCSMPYLSTVSTTALSRLRVFNRGPAASYTSWTLAMKVGSMPISCACLRVERIDSVNWSSFLRKATMACITLLFSDSLHSSARASITTGFCPISSLSAFTNSLSRSATLPPFKASVTSVTSFSWISISRTMTLRLV
eukprot:CAMPEP_0173337988 /NCGR_PEP_ID=MMETSP1144-20121109/7503_1 /TAXON_ID=483371 /ORGANISM="non described non described, Strain CCMP2298" /LENGTH=161 /DNA_ID=CAMNT_0014283623 /DNA_START=18 /DNA_END=499 /DNA_ORIENTATION=+